VSIEREIRKSGERQIEIVVAFVSALLFELISNESTDAIGG